MYRVPDFQQPFSWRDLPLSQPKAPPCSREGGHVDRSLRLQPRFALSRAEYAWMNSPVPFTRCLRAETLGLIHLIFLSPLSREAPRPQGVSRGAQLGSGGGGRPRSRRPGSRAHPLSRSALPLHSGHTAVGLWRVLTGKAFSQGSPITGSRWQAHPGSTATSGAHRTLVIKACRV